MIGELILIGNVQYLKINKSGTLEKLPKMKWYWILYFSWVSMFRSINVSEIYRAVGKIKK